MLLNCHCSCEGAAPWFGFVIVAIIIAAFVLLDWLGTQISMEDNEEVENSNAANDHERKVMAYGAKQRMSSVRINENGRLVDNNQIELDLK